MTICAPERRRGASSTWREAGDGRSWMATFDTSAAGSAAGGQTFTRRAAPRIAGADTDGNSAGAPARRVGRPAVRWHRLHPRGVTFRREACDADPRAEPPGSHD